jgi:hypothetical protein
LQNLMAPSRYRYRASRESRFWGTDGTEKAQQVEQVYARPL